MKPLFFSIFFLSFQLIMAQGLPKGFAPNEKEPNFLQSIGVNQNPYENRIYNPEIFNEPPNFSKRTMAEWEEIEALTISWSTDYFINEELILSAIVENTIDEAKVFIVCENPLQVENYLSSQNISLENVVLIEAPVNSIWIRDYGQNTVYKNKVEDRFLVDWFYNRNRPNDDLVPEAIASTLSLDIYETTESPWDLMATGGNFMTDGMGTGFSSKLIIEENSGGYAWNGQNFPSHNLDEINNIMNEFMGIDNYILMEVLPYDDIHHIDMHMKLLDEQTVLVAEYPEGIADGPQIEANLQYVLSNFNSAFGTPYKVIRIPSPPSTQGNYPDNDGLYRTYTNSVFVNKTVLVPFYRTEYDTIAQRIYEDALPGYKIVGIDVDNNNTNLISYSGAIHCITHSVGVEDPLLIQHQTLDNKNVQINYQVDAYIEHVSGIEMANVYWKTDLNQDFEIVEMNNIDGNNWSANISGDINPGDYVYYYISATANSGKKQSRPMTSPEGFYKFQIIDESADIETTNLLSNSISVYPNPANAITCIPIQSSKSSYGSITMYDVFGNKVKDIYKGKIEQGRQNYFINARNFASGVYFIVLEKDNQYYRQKLVIK